MMYINHLSTHCTFIYLPLKILKLLHWEQTTNRTSRNIKNTQLLESELRVNISCLQNTSVQQMKRISISSPTVILSLWIFCHLEWFIYKLERASPSWPLALLGSSWSLTRCKNLGRFSFFLFFVTSYFPQYSSAILTFLSFLVSRHLPEMQFFFLNTRVRGWAGLERFLNATCPYNLTQMINMTMIS